MQVLKGVDDLTKYESLKNQLWYYLEHGQYENPIDAEAISECISDQVMEAFLNKEITVEELNKLNGIYDTGIEWVDLQSVDK